MKKQDLTTYCISLVRLLDPGDDLEQGGFARAVGADQAHAFSLIDAQGGFGKQGTGRESLAQAGMPGSGKHGVKICLTFLAFTCTSEVWPFQLLEHFPGSGRSCPYLSINSFQS